MLSKTISTLNPLNTLLTKNHITKYSPKVNIFKILLYRVQTSFACSNYIFCSSTELLKRFGTNFVLCSVSQVESNTVAVCSRLYVQNLGHPRLVAVGTFKYTFARFLPIFYKINFLITFQCILRHFRVFIVFTFFVLSSNGFWFLPLFLVLHTTSVQMSFF